MVFWMKAKDILMNCFNGTTECHSGSKDMNMSKKQRGMVILQLLNCKSKSLQAVPAVPAVPAVEAVEAVPTVPEIQMKTDHELKKVVYSDLPDFDLHGKFDCKVVRVFDGDTLHAAINIDGDMYRIQCRLKGIDTPEMPRAHIDAMTPESIRAYRARDRLIELVTNIDMSILETKDEHYNSVGISMPSLTDMDMQKIIDEQNTLVLKDALILEGREKYGRSLATLDISGVGNINEILIREGHAVPYM